MAFCFYFLSHGVSMENFTELSLDLGSGVQMAMLIDESLLIPFLSVVTLFADALVIRNWPISGSSSLLYDSGRSQWLCVRLS